MNLYELNNVKKYYGFMLVLDIPSLSLAEGNFYVFYGPNAAGKTTLLNLLAGLDRPAEGEILFHNGGIDIREATMVMQNPYLFKTTVMKNISTGLTWRGADKRKIKEIVTPVMRHLGIWKLRDRDVRTLSGGEKRKVAVARAIALDTKVLLLDEPASHLDKIHIDLIENTIRSISGNSKKTVIMTTHDLHMAHRLTANVIYLLNGRLTDKPLWNMFQVELTGTGKVKKAESGSGTEIYATTARTGAASIAIDPTDIIVSQKAIHSSALNSLKGRVIGVNEINGIVDLVINVKIILHAFITHRSFDTMHLGIGKEVFVTFKASAVEVF